jgi:hypothetical protein
MPGYNHYPWCVCGWCYKHSQGGYSTNAILAALPRFDAEQRIKREGAHRSWTACFLVPNARCPVCSESVWYYENIHGSRVFFDEIGYPWPKHPCTDNSQAGARTGPAPAVGPIEERKLGHVMEILEAARCASFDPNSAFRTKYGYSPWDLLEVTETFRVGFDNFVKARSIAPPLDEPVFLRFTSARIASAVGDHFSLDEAGENVSVVDRERLESHRLKSTILRREEYEYSQATRTTTS